MKPALRVVPYSPPSAAEKVRQRIKAKASPSILECRCGSREFIEARQGVTLSGPKPTRGRRVLLCAACMLRGERVVVA